MSKSGYCSISGEYCDSLDEHHIIPREYGGLNGPTIFLSPTVHQTIHRIFNNDKAVANFASRYPVNGFKVYRLVEALRLAQEKLPHIQSDSISISLNLFSEREREILLKNAEQYNMSLGSLIVNLVKKVLA